MDGYKALNMSDEAAVAQFVADNRRVVNALITLSTIYSPTEANFSNYALLRDHVLRPLFASAAPPTPDTLSTLHHHVPPLFHPHVQTADLLRSLRILEKYTPPQLLLDSKCGYTGFTPACQRDAKRILDSFFLSRASADDLPWDLVDDDAAIRTDFSQVAIAIDSITVGRFRVVFW